MGKHCRFANINGSELESPWVGETQRNVRELFRALNEHDGPTILYIDEAESIGRHRGQGVLAGWWRCTTKSIPSAFGPATWYS